MGRGHAEQTGTAMNQDKPQRQVRIINKTTGETRLSEPVRAHAPRGNDSDENLATTSFGGSEKRDVASSGDSPSQTKDGPGEKLRDRAQDSGPGGESVGNEKRQKKGKPKIEIRTLEQFIEYAYGRKGLSVPMKSKVEKELARNPRFDEGSIERLQVLAEQDAQFAVPRQLLLASREVEGFPVLRGALTGFVKDLMLRHPAFGSPRLRAAMLNQEGACSMAEAIKAVLGYEPDKSREGALKPAELQALRKNLALSLATWFVCARGMSLDELASLLMDAIWGPAAKAVDDDNGRMRLLTEVAQPEVLGIVGQRWRQQATEARNAQLRAEGEAEAARARAEGLRTELEQERASVASLGAKLAELEMRSEKELALERQWRHDECAHLRHDFEVLQGRIRRRLDESVEMLEVGLGALRKAPPRIEVMLERAEAVVDSLRAEQNELKGD